MRKLTLADCENVKTSDLFIGFAIFNAGPEDAEAIEAQKNSPEEIQKTNDMFDEVRKNLENESDENMPSGFFDKVMSMVKNVAKNLPTMYGSAMILLKKDGQYYSLDLGEETPEDAIRIDHIEPLSNYYSEDEYKFVEENGKVCLDFESLEPIERYTKKVLKGYALI